MQDLPVKVIKPADAQMMKEPLCPDPDVGLSVKSRQQATLTRHAQVHIVLPPLGGLLHTVERLGRVSHTLQLAVNHNGQLSLRAESDLASVQTDWRDLQQPDFSSDATQAPLATEDEARSGELKTEKMQFETVSVDQRSFVKFLSSHVIANTTVACERCVAFLNVTRNAHAMQQLYARDLPAFAMFISAQDLTGVVS